MYNQIREEINKFKNFTINEAVQSDFKTNQKKLRQYIKILKNNYEKGIIRDEGGDINNFDIMIRYFTIIHNFLALENKYSSIISLSGKELNNNLILPKTTNYEDVIYKFNQLYNPNSPVRFSVETLDSIDEVSNFLKENPDFLSKLHK
jgi:hypothetical protein